MSGFYIKMWKKVYSQLRRIVLIKGIVTFKTHRPKRELVSLGRKY